MRNLIWIGAIIVAIVGLFIWGAAGSSASLPFQTGVIDQSDVVKGNASSTVVLMEYSDFQCPACRSYYPVIRQLVQQFGDRVAFVYRDYPLSSIHANAEFAARAAQAARKQGKFWEMHDLLFEKQDEWASEGNVTKLEATFTNYAALIGINTEQFKTDWRSKEIKDYVRAEKTHAVKSGLVGTPTFFLGGKQIANPNSLEEFQTIIQNALSN